MEYEPVAYTTTNVYVSTLEGDPVAVGVVERLTSEDALIAITAPLQPGDTLRVILTDYRNRPEQVERYAEVQSVREAFDPDEGLIAECHVRRVDVACPGPSWRPCSSWTT